MLDFEEFYTGEIADEIWRSHGKYLVSNYGRVKKPSLNRFLKPCKIGYQVYYTMNSKRTNIRKILPELFQPQEIIYDLGIPPRKRFIDRIKAGHFCVYKIVPSKAAASKGNFGKKKWRMMIKKGWRYFTEYYVTEDEAKRAYVKKYCEIQDWDFTEVLKDWES